MKPFLLLFLLFISLYFTTAKIYKFHQDAFKKSLNTWKALKYKSYDYTIVIPGIDTVSRTTIQVRNGKVVRRTFIETDFFHYPNSYENFWDEKTPNEIGSHTGE